MAIWKEQTSPKNGATTTLQEPSPRREASPMIQESAPRREDRLSTSSSSHDLTSRTKERESKESHIAADLTIEGKIEGSGHVRMAGRFKGDVAVDGDLTIEQGAKITGGVRARTVIIGGELEGNIEGAAKVELLDTGVLNGDVKAGSLTVAAGSRMRGQVAFGWEEKHVPEPRVKMVIDSAP